MARIVPFTEARGKLSDLLDELERQHEHLVITRNGRPAGVLLSPLEYEALQETVEVLQDEATIGALLRSEEDLAAGRLYGWDEVKRELGLA
jgi:prevent-host-death family protein